MANGIILKQGDSLKLNVDYKDSLNSPINLNGFTLIFRVFDTANNTILRLDSSSNTIDKKIEFIDRNNGIFYILVTDTSKLPNGNFSADIQYIDPNGIKQSSKSFGLKIVDKL